jgi:hypothetical protein
VAIVVLVLARDLGPISAMIESSPPSSSSTMSPSAAPKARSSSI